MNAQERVLLLRHRRQRRQKAKGGGGKIVVRIVAVLVLLGLVSTLATMLTGLGTVVAVYGHYAKDLPDPNKIVTAQEKFETTKIYDRTGTVLLMEVIDPRRGDRTLLPLDQIPEDFRNATIALEDKTFYENLGIDPTGIARAFILEPSGWADPGRQLHHGAVDQEHPYPRGRALPEIVCPQDQRSHPGARDFAPVLQGSNPGVVSEHQLLWQLGHRRGGGCSGLFWQTCSGIELWPRVPCWRPLSSIRP